MQHWYLLTRVSRSRMMITRDKARNFKEDSICHHAKPQKHTCRWKNRGFQKIRCILLNSYRQLFLPPDYGEASNHKRDFIHSYYQKNWNNGKSLDWFYIRIELLHHISKTLAEKLCEMRMKTSSVSSVMLSGSDTSLFLSMVERLNITDLWDFFTVSLSSETLYALF